MKSDISFDAREERWPYSLPVLSVSARTFLRTPKCISISLIIDAYIRARFSRLFLYLLSLTYGLRVIAFTANIIRAR